MESEAWAPALLMALAFTTTLTVGAVVTALDAVPDKVITMVLPVPLAALVIKPSGTPVRVRSFALTSVFTVPWLNVKVQLLSLPSMLWFPLAILTLLSLAVPIILVAAGVRVKLMASEAWAPVSLTALALITAVMVGAAVNAWSAVPERVINMVLPVPLDALAARPLGMPVIVRSLAVTPDFTVPVLKVRVQLLSLPSMVWFPLAILTLLSVALAVIFSV